MNQPPARTCASLHPSYVRSGPPTTHASCRPSWRRRAPSGTRSGGALTLRLRAGRRCTARWRSFRTTLRRPALNWRCGAGSPAAASTRYVRGGVRACACTWNETCACNCTGGWLGCPRTAAQRSWGARGPPKWQNMPSIHTS
eukprot:42193-Chlamydomonas_euryale.AAC.3